MEERLRDLLQGRTEDKRDGRQSRGGSTTASRQQLSWAGRGCLAVVVLGKVSERRMDHDDDDEEVPGLEMGM